MKRKVKFKAKVIEDYMEKEGLNKTQFCKRCGCSMFVLNRLLRGESYVSLDHIIKLHNLLKIPVEEMYVITENEYL